MQWRSSVWSGEWVCSHSVDGVIINEVKLMDSVPFSYQKAANKGVWQMFGCWFLPPVPPVPYTPPDPPTRPPPFAPRSSRPRAEILSWLVLIFTAVTKLIFRLPFCRWFGRRGRLSQGVISTRRLSHFLSQSSFVEWSSQSTYQTETDTVTVCRLTVSSARLWNMTSCMNAVSQRVTADLLCKDSLVTFFVSVRHIYYCYCYLLHSSTLCFDDRLYISTYFTEKRKFLWNRPGAYFSFLFNKVYIFKSNF